MLLAKYFVHGILFSILGLVFVFVWAWVFVVLVLFGSFLGLLIGFLVLFLMMGWLNSVITGFVWHIPIKTNWTTVLIHGFVLSIVFVIVHIPSLFLSLGFPSAVMVILLLIVYAFVDGFIARRIAGIWQRKEAPEMVVETPKTFLKSCVNCGKDIPIASETCPHCGAEQKKKQK
jgi:hypothetical protein